jgi:hypothetical protein
MRASFDRELTLSGHPAQPAKTRIPRGLFVTVGADFFRGHRRPELIENKKMRTAMHFLLVFLFCST